MNFNIDFETKRFLLVCVADVAGVICLILAIYSALDLLLVWNIYAAIYLSIVFLGTVLHKFGKFQPIDSYNVRKDLPLTVYHYSLMRQDAEPLRGPQITLNPSRGIFRNLGNLSFGESVFFFEKPASRVQLFVNFFGKQRSIRTVIAMQININDNHIYLRKIDGVIAFPGVCLGTRIDVKLFV